MSATTFDRFGQVITVLPYLWGFAAAAALDHVIDIQIFFLPTMACAAAASAGLVMRRMTGR